MANNAYNWGSYLKENPDHPNNGKYHNDLTFPDYNNFLDIDAFNASMNMPKTTPPGRVDRNLPQLPFSHTLSPAIPCQFSDEEINKAMEDTISKQNPGAEITGAKEKSVEASPSFINGSESSTFDSGKPMNGFPSNLSPAANTAVKDKSATPLASSVSGHEPCTSDLDSSMKGFPSSSSPEADTAAKGEGAEAFLLNADISLLSDDQWSEMLLGVGLSPLLPAADTTAKQQGVTPPSLNNLATVETIQNKPSLPAWDTNSLPPGSSGVTAKPESFQPPLAYNPLGTENNQVNTDFQYVPMNASSPGGLHGAEAIEYFDPYLDSSEHNASITEMRTLKTLAPNMSMKNLSTPMLNAGAGTNNESFQHPSISTPLFLETKQLPTAGTVTNKESFQRPSVSYPLSFDTNGLKKPSPRGSKRKSRDSIEKHAQEPHRKKRGPHKKGTQKYKPSQEPQQGPKQYQQQQQRQIQMQNQEQQESKMRAQRERQIAMFLEKQLPQPNSQEDDVHMAEPIQQETIASFNKPKQQTRFMSLAGKQQVTRINAQRRQMSSVAPVHRQQASGPIAQGTHSSSRAPERRQQQDGTRSNQQQNQGNTQPLGSVPSNLKPNETNMVPPGGRPELDSIQVVKLRVLRESEPAYDIRIETRVACLNSEVLNKAFNSILGRRRPKAYVLKNTTVNAALLLTSWMYGQDANSLIPPNCDFKNDADYHASLMVLTVLAEKLKMTTLRDQACTRFATLFKERGAIPVNVPKYVWENSAPKSYLRKLIIEMCALDAQVDGDLLNGEWFPKDLAIAILLKRGERCHGPTHERV
jgi:hypothetical protein